MAEADETQVLVDRSAAHISKMLMKNPLDLNELAFTKYPVLALGDIPATRVREIHEKIVDEIFSVVSMTRDSAPQCWDRCVTQLESGKVLLATIFTEFDGYRTIKKACKKALRLPRMDEALCLPAPIRVSLIASLKYRKVAAARPHSSIIDMLGAHNSMAWLKVAIQVFELTHTAPFLVRRDDSVGSPTTDISNGIWTVKATMPLPHRYLAFIHRQLPILRAAHPFGLRRTKSAPQEIVDDFKTIYALYRSDGLRIPSEIHNVAAYSLSRDQHKEVLASWVDQEMAGG
ncbi:hypothetical protein FMEXI_5493 [Fusarium mexicanum]|uniref:Uncharacterized protein n=1 Tax=Fusarium mexicanum TaxID=751941 RepID=A0A8H5MZM2_9HYPO|nr:hypothetical protein FMEXI_5493 [Fusarium mexicanum]